MRQGTCPFPSLCIFIYSLSGGLQVIIVSGLGHCFKSFSQRITLHFKILQAKITTNSSEEQVKYKDSKSEVK